MKWKDKLVKYVIDELTDDINWKYIADKFTLESPIGIHLAIFNEPYLSLVLDEKKKIESRFSVNRVMPFMKVAKGDIILMKEAGGAITGLFVAGEVVYYSGLKPSILKEIETKYADLICSSYDSTFWESRKKAKYCTLIEVSRAKRINQIRDGKSDKMGWSVIRSGISDGLFN